MGWEWGRDWNILFLNAWMICMACTTLSVVHYCICVCMFYYATHLWAGTDLGLVYIPQIVQFNFLILTFIWISLVNFLIYVLSVCKLKINSILFYSILFYIVYVAMYSQICKNMYYRIWIKTTITICISVFVFFANLNSITFVMADMCWCNRWDLNEMRK